MTTYLYRADRRADGAAPEPVVDEKCHASVVDEDCKYDSRQCNKRATKVGCLCDYRTGEATSEFVPLCTSHAKASNVFVKKEI